MQSASFYRVFKALRALVQQTELKEEMKWGSPCYTLKGKNVVMLAAFKEHCAMSFFKGALLNNDEGALETVGPNTQAARLLKFTTLAEVKKRKTLIKRLLREAIAIEKAGKTFEYKKKPEAMPEELRALLNSDKSLQKAFDALTPGRQRSHILHVGGAKQSKTRAARSLKCADKIRAGKGYLDR